ncbi:MAG: NAD(P)-dependent oxidoreductase [Ruminococcus sp.]|nr:NAD(P)-dependent oxidoreductase [Candidatus Copronaster equi]
MNILVTGGAGYIGSILVPELLKEGNNVTVLDNFYYKQSSLIDCCKYKTFSIINGDVNDEEVPKKAVEVADLIYPLAALVGFPVCDKNKITAINTNLKAIEKLLAIREPSQKIIFPCTNSGYGLGQGQQYCTEESPITPISLYGKTKMEAERIILESGNSVTLRFATLFGASPRMRTDLLVNDFVYRAVFDRSLIVFEGSFMRNYLHVRDAASALMFAKDNFEAMKGQTFNCGLDEANMSKLELCAVIKKFIPDFTYMEAPIGKDPDQRNYIVSNEKIKSYGFKTECSLEDGIQELIKTYSIIKNSAYGNV